MIRTPTAAFRVSFPELSADPFNFTFTTTLPFGTVAFKFMWFNEVWNIWLTLPTGEIRQMGGFPNSVDWTGFDDYYAQLVTMLDSIGQNDLSKTTLMVYQL
jgi:hypothetical protein